jgi:hypothetical protein
MKVLHILALGALLVGVSPATAQNVSLEFKDGRVRLSAQNVSTSQILAEWSKRGQTTIVNGERLPGPPVTLELQDVPEQQALDVVLRGVSGYLAGSRETDIAGASSFDRILILPTSSRPTNAATPPPPQQALQAVQDDPNEDAPPPGPRPNPVVRLPPSQLPPAGAARPPVPVPDNSMPDPENRPAPPANNPFGVAPGTSRPGVITPAPATPPREP